MFFTVNLSKELNSSKFISSTYFSELFRLWKEYAEGEIYEREEDEKGGKELENDGKVVKEVVFVGEKDDGGEYAVQKDEVEVLDIDDNFWFIFMLLLLLLLLL